ncbi:nonstructural protein 2 [Chaphamaparvovirus galliform4]|uniref:Nonstructural protein 2 n=1 Tax=Chaphamaparvovirus galliform4 TaxID=3052109 RepID=A0ABY4D957_9VIRU|nr:nonstructural protein 2 [Chaphamaparvovirus galliform4]
MTCLMVYLFVELLNQAANAAIASNVAAGRLLLASQQLQECREANNPYKNSWIPGLAPANLQWAPDPCAEQEEALQNLMKQGAAEGNQVATQQLGGAPAPQLAVAMDPVPNTDPSIPMNEFVTPVPGAQNQWSPLVPDDVLEMIVDNYPEGEEPEEMMLDQILDGMLKYQMWCPWGEPGRKNARWKFIYKPINSRWVGNWTPK